MARFRINYEQVIRQANTINNLSDDLNREIRKMEGVLNSMRADWKGPASATFQNKLSLLIANIRDTEGSMASVSSTIKNVATQIQKEDERQAELARKLADKGSAIL